MSRVTYWNCVHLSVSVTTSEMFPSSSAIPRRTWVWHVWTLLYSTLLPYTSYSLKGRIFAQGHCGVTSGSTLTLSWEINEACVQKDSPRTVHICANQLCFATTVFFSAQSDEIRRHKCATFPTLCTYIIQDLHTKIARGHPGDRQGWLYLRFLRS